MFTGIVEETGKITGISKQNSNTIINVSCSFIDELKINQSVCHNGICLSVSEIKDEYYQSMCCEGNNEKIKPRLFRNWQFN